MPKDKKAQERIPYSFRIPLRALLWHHGIYKTKKQDEIIDSMYLLGYCKLSGEPPIICLCGSTRFTEQMLVKQWGLTKQGCIVLSWCALPASYFQGKDNAHVGDQEGVKEIVDEVHLRKIDLADEVFVLNVDGYIGESTSREINYAMKHGKPVKYLETISSPMGSS